MLNFIAIDFETASASRDSACSLGAVTVRDGVIVDRRYSLIKPNGPFSEFCIRVHGITEKDVETAPTFSDIYPVVYKLLNNQVVVAHNANFDIGVLRASCESRNLLMPNVTPFCTVDMSRIAWPDLPKHKLNTLCDEFHFPLNHHNAIADATACGQILLRCADELHATSIEDLQNTLAKRKAKQQRKAKKLMELSKSNAQ